MKGDVAFLHLLRRIKIAFHALCQGEDLSCLRWGAPERGERNSAQFNGAAHVINLLDGDLVRQHRVVEDDGQHGVINAAHAGTPAVANLDDPHGCKRTERLAHHRPRNTHLQRESLLAGDGLAPAKTLIANMLVDGMHGAGDKALTRLGCS